MQLSTLLTLHYRSPLFACSSTQAEQVKASVLFLFKSKFDCFLCCLTFHSIFHSAFHSIPRSAFYTYPCCTERYNSCSLLLCMWNGYSTEASAPLVLHSKRTVCSMRPYFWRTGDRTSKKYTDISKDEKINLFLFIYPNLLYLSRSTHWLGSGHAQLLVKRYWTIISVEFCPMSDGYYPSSLGPD